MSTLDSLTVIPYQHHIVETDEMVWAIYVVERCELILTNFKTEEEVVEELMHYDAVRNDVVGFFTVKREAMLPLCSTGNEWTMIHLGNRDMSWMFGDLSEYALVNYGHRVCVRMDPRYEGARVLHLRDHKTGETASDAFLHLVDPFIDSDVACLDAGLWSIFIAEYTGDDNTFMKQFREAVKTAGMYAKKEMFIYLGVNDCTVLGGPELCDVDGNRPWLVVENLNAVDIFNDFYLMPNLITDDATALARELIDDDRND